MNKNQIIKFRNEIIGKETWQNAVLNFNETDNTERTVFECDGRTVSWNQYESITDHIADVLSQRKIGPGKIVALRTKRTEKLYLALYGIVKAGAALLPIPADTPMKRLENIYEQVHVDLTIDDVEYEKIIREIVNEKQKTEFAKPDDPALILFTSGSTGVPKGVLHTQKDILYAGLQVPTDLKISGIECGLFNTVIAKTNINFISAYLFEIAMPVFHNKKLVILTDEEQNSPIVIGNEIENNQDPLIFLTPSQADNYLNDEKFVSQFQNLRTLILAGEKLSDDICKKIINKSSSTLSILNLYGSTECELIAGIDVRNTNDGHMLPMMDTDIAIIDENGQIVENNQLGEIAVASPHQFLKYTGTKMETAEINGISYFCSGDLGRRYDDGTISVQGRKDRMVKFHGIRVELSDIEKNICRYPGILECATVINKTEHGTDVLCAYYVNKDAMNIDIQSLRNFLLDYLPVNLIPMGMVHLDALPLNENGKRDNKALARRIYIPEKAEIKGINKKEAEMTDILCNVISKTCGENVAPDDNLISLGVDSLTAFKIISNLNNVGWMVNLEDIFSHPVIYDLAECLKKINKINSDNKTFVDDGNYTATGIQLYWGTDVDFNKKTRGLYVTENFITSKLYDKKEFQARISVLLKKHPAMRSQISFENMMPSQTILEMSDVNISSLEEISNGNSDVKKEDKKIFCLVDYQDIINMRDGTTSPFELSKAQSDFLDEYKKTLMGVLANSDTIFAFQAACFRISENATLIVITGNHASIDGTSMNILMQEIISDEIDEEEDCYRKFLKYIGNQENIGKAINFYVEYLKKGELCDFPTVKTDKENPEPVFRGVTLPLEENGTKALISRSKKENVSSIGYLMYIYGQSLLNTLNKESLIMQILTFGRGVPISGMDKAVGCFIEYVPIVVGKNDTVQNFQKGYLAAEQNSFAPLPVIWKQAFGLDELPELPPFLISEIFPEIETSGVFKRLSDLDYEKMFMGNFIVKNDEKITIYFHYNASQLNEEVFLKVTDYMRNSLKELK